MTSESTTEKTVVAVERAFAVLHTLAAADESLGVSAIARATGLAKSTTSRFLTTLERLRMVERVSDDGRYRLGAGLNVFESRGVPSLVELARPYLRDLADEVGEDAGLAVSDGFDVLYVDQIQQSEAVQVQDWTGERLPPHAVAAGFILMRDWPPAKVDAYLAGSLEPLAPGTITDPTAVRRRIERWSDHLWTHDEFAVDINGVAAPVYGPDGAIVAAVNLYGPSYRFPGERSETAIGGLLADAGARISRHLEALWFGGGRSPTETIRGAAG